MEEKEKRNLFGVSIIGLAEMPWREKEKEKRCDGWPLGRDSPCRERRK